jgi:carbon-monoxide dehydrogenase medium subunit
MKERLVSPTQVIDIKGVKQLRQLKYESGRGLTIGACVTLADLAESDVVKERYTALHEAVSRAADPMIRGRATLVGNLCEAIPWVDSPPALIALDASVEIVGAGGKRNVSAEAFIKGPVEIDVQPGEFVSYLRLPEAPNLQTSTFHKFSAGAEFSLVNVAAAVVLEKKRRARLVYGGVGPTPVRSSEAEKVVADEEVTEASINKAAQVAGETVECVSDVLASSDYRRHLVQVLTMRALRRIFEK